jgi:hypothetical protein
VSVAVVAVFSPECCQNVFIAEKERKNKNNRLETVKCAAADDIPRVRLPAGQ